MSQYLSEAWLELGRKAINANTEFQRIAKGMNLIISHKIIEVPTKGVVWFWSRFEDGKCVEVKLGEHKNPHFILSGTYSIWRQIHEGKLDLLLAVLEKKLQIIGKPLKGIKILKLVPVMSKTIAAIETDYRSLEERQD
ncbi:MAG: hypothetical protein ACTSRS_00670 [Candidatus Helarchaeota archaeon]